MCLPERSYIALKFQPTQTGESSSQYVMKNNWNLCQAITGGNNVTLTKHDCELSCLKSSANYTLQVDVHQINHLLKKDGIMILLVNLDYVNIVP